MYSCIRNVQILVKLLKENNISKVVLSPGGSDIPIIHTIETDNFFKCYSVVDERNATYFALGLSQQTQEPVACVCTSGTAVCNYLPGITEAYYQNARIVAITADKNPYYQDQLETQKIDQMNIFNNVVKKSVELPIVRNEEDEWLCNRLVNEALVEMNHHGSGPVHINIPIMGDGASYVQEVKNERRIQIIENFHDSDLSRFAKILSEKEKILVVVGQNIQFDENDKIVMEEFFEKFNCCLTVEHLSNLNCKGTVYTYPISEMNGLNDNVLPDLVISIGNNLSAYNLKPFLRNNFKRMENWYISPSGKIRDAYKSLTYVFECKEIEFFKEMNKFYNTKNNYKYYNSLRSLKEMVKIPELEFSNMYIARELSKIIPENSILHLAILNSTRTMQFFDLKDNVKTYSNVGTLGIDGCLATFVGQAAATENKAFLLIGDLSFFYDMNAAALKSVGNNIRIILDNNGGGSEFHFFMGKEKISTINDYISAGHNRTARGWIESLGYDYYAVNSAEDLEKLKPILENDSERPIFVEAFSEMEDDAKRINKIYHDNKINYLSKIGGKEYIKEVIKDKISEDKRRKISNILKKFKK